LVLMSARAAARGARLRGVYYRRILWLLVFGLVHGYLIWAGDILVFYALCGLWLYFFRPLAPRVLIPLGVGLVVFAYVLMLGLTVFAGFAEQTAVAVAAARAANQEPEKWEVDLAGTWNEGLKPFFRPDSKEIEEEIDVFQRGSYGEIV